MSKDMDLHRLELDAGVAVESAVSAARELLPVIIGSEEEISISEAIMLMGLASMWISDIQTGTILQYLENIRESVDYAGAKPAEFWMQSDLAAIDKANELGINILPEYSMADLRYKIYCTIHEVL